MTILNSKVTILLYDYYKKYSTQQRKWTRRRSLFLNLCFIFSYRSAYIFNLYTTCLLWQVCHWKTNFISYVHSLEINVNNFLNHQYLVYYTCRSVDGDSCWYYVFYDVVISKCEVAHFVEIIRVVGLRVGNFNLPHFTVNDPLFSSL